MSTQEPAISPTKQKKASKKSKKKKSKKKQAPSIGEVSWNITSLPTLTYITHSHLGLAVKFNCCARASPEPAFESADASASIFGDEAIARHLVRVHGSAAAPSLYGSTPVEQSQVDQWIDFSIRRFGGAGAPAVADSLAVADMYLRTRSFLVGGSITLADFAMWAALNGADVASTTMEHFPYVTRWRASIGADKAIRMAKGKMMTMLRQATKKVAADTAAAAAAESAKKANGKQSKKKGKGAGKADAHAKGGVSMGKMDDLENVTDPTKVVTRFPPEPSGYMHIGHVKAALLNYYYAKEKYKGKMILRFDDTNPNNEKGEYVEMIQKDLLRLGVKPDKLTHTSDSFDRIAAFARQAIGDDLAYMDCTEAEAMKLDRRNCIESKYRVQAKEETLKLFERMYAGDDDYSQWCLRIRIPTSFWVKNSAMRDPVIFRMNKETPHHRTGTKYKAYPTYDFACPIVDAFEGVTHAMRTTEYRMRDQLYHWIGDKLRIRHVYIQEFGRLNFAYTVMSKRKLRKLVECGEVEGWTDPRFPTVQGIFRRGIQLESMKSFILSQGFSTKDQNMAWDKFWGNNARYLDKIAARYMAVGKDTAVRVTLSGLDADTIARGVPTPLHPKDPSMGQKIVRVANKVLVEQTDANDMKEGDVVTLMRWGNIKITAVTRDGERVTAVAADADLDNKNFKKTQKVTWVADVPELVEVERCEFDHLILKKKLEKEDKLEDHLTTTKHPTKATTIMLADPNIGAIKEDSVVQLERVGYFRCDKVLSPTSTMVLFQIPDGKASSMSSLSSALGHR